jgi:hypothetical protein
MLGAACDADRGVSVAARGLVFYRAAQIMAAKGGGLRERVVGDVAELVEEIVATHDSVTNLGGVRLYRLLHEMGILGPAAPPTLRALHTRGQRTVSELVDGYGIVCRPVRDVLVYYLAERQAAVALLGAARDAFAWSSLQRRRDELGPRRRASANAGTLRAVDPASGDHRELVLEEDRAFWAFAIVEVLRATGVRIEELLELDHHSVVQYRLPSTGEVLPLLQIAPSKTDTERPLVMTRELAEVLSAIIVRVVDRTSHVPLVPAYGPPLEAVVSAAVAVLPAAGEGREPGDLLDGRPGARCPRASDNGTVGSSPLIRGLPTMTWTEPTLRKEPTVSKPNSAAWNTTWVGLDVHRDSITSAVVGPQCETRRRPLVYDEPSVRRFVSGLGSPARVRLCYEAGPTGYDLACLLKRLGVATEAIAPSLIPVTPGAKIKTDRETRKTWSTSSAGPAKSCSTT